MGGSHGFQGEQREDQSLPTECKGETMKKLTAKTLPMGEGKNIEGPLGGNQINFFVTQTKSYKPPPPLEGLNNNRFLIITRVQCSLKKLMRMSFLKNFW